MDAMLKVEGINVYYGAIHAIKDVSFQVNEGEVVTLIGANGAGKSTILKTIAGLLTSHTGSIEFLGQRLGGTPAHKIITKGLALVPEGRQIFLQMSVEENLEMGAFTRPSSEFDDGIADVYQRFPRLKERRRQVAGTLSGGEQQMLAISRALMARPRLLLLDEPSLGLAPIIIQQIFQIIQRVNANGTTVFLVEQNANQALRIAHRGYVMENGRIVTSDSAENLLRSEDVRSAYLGM